MKTITQRIDAITAIPEEYRHEIIPAPRSVKIELSTRCNYQCSFCVRSVRENDAKDISPNLYYRLLREMRESGVDELGLFYINEPFISDWLPTAIAEAKTIGFPYVFLTTNGSVATRKKLEACMQAGLNSLKFSVNFGDLDQFKDVAGVSPKLYLRALENLQVARRVRDEGKYPCRIYASSIQFDGDQGRRMREVVENDVKPYVDEFYWLPLFSMQGASEQAGMQPQPGNPGRVGAMRDPLPCWSCFTEGHITADGKLSACCFGNGVDDDLVMADLNHTHFMVAWNSQKFQELRRAHLARDVSATACAACAAG